MQTKFYGFMHFVTEVLQQQPHSAVASAAQTKKAAIQELCVMCVVLWALIIYCMQQITVKNN